MSDLSSLWGGQKLDFGAVRSEDDPGRVKLKIETQRRMILSSSISKFNPLAY